MGKQAKIVVVFNEKGGAGKTHTCCHVAGTFGLGGHDVMVADLDSQGTSSAWLTAQDGANFPGNLWVGHAYGKRASDKLQEHMSKYDIIFVDCAPSVKNDCTWSALLVCDLAIIPTKLSPGDIIALPAAFKLAKEAQHEAERDFPVRVLPVAYQRSKKDQTKALERLQTKPMFPEFPTLKDCVLSDRVAYPRGLTYGAPAQRLPNGSEAAAELASVAAAIAKLLGITVEKKGARK